MALDPRVVLVNIPYYVTYVFFWSLFGLSIVFLASSFKRPFTLTCQQILTYLEHGSYACYTLTENLFDSVNDLKSIVSEGCFIVDNFLYDPELLRPPSKKDSIKPLLMDPNGGKLLKIDGYSDVVTYVNNFGFVLLRTRTSIVLFTNSKRFIHNYKHFEEVIRGQLTCRRRHMHWLWSWFFCTERLVYVDISKDKAYIANIDFLNLRNILHLTIRENLLYMIHEQKTKGDKFGEKRSDRFAGYHEFELNILKKFILKYYFHHRLLFNNIINDFMIEALEKYPLISREKKVISNENKLKENHNHSNKENDKKRIEFDINAYHGRSSLISQSINLNSIGIHFEQEKLNYRIKQILRNDEYLWPTHQLQVKSFQELLLLDLEMNNIIFPPKIPRQGLIESNLSLSHDSNHSTHSNLSIRSFQEANPSANGIPHAEIVSNNYDYPHSTGSYSQKAQRWKESIDPSTESSKGTNQYRKVRSDSKYSTDSSSVPSKGILTSSNNDKPPKGPVKAMELVHPNMISLENEETKALLSPEQPVIGSGSSYSSSGDTNIRMTNVSPVPKSPKSVRIREGTAAESNASKTMGSPKDGPQTVQLPGPTPTVVPALSYLDELVEMQSRKRGNTLELEGEKDIKFSDEGARNIARKFENLLNHSLSAADEVIYLNEAIESLLEFIRKRKLELYALVALKFFHDYTIGRDHFGNDERREIICDLFRERYAMPNPMMIRTQSFTTIMDAFNLVDIYFIPTRHNFLRVLTNTGISKNMLYSALYTAFGAEKMYEILSIGVIRYAEFIDLLETINLLYDDSFRPFVMIVDNLDKWKTNPWYLKGIVKAYDELKGTKIGGRNPSLILIIYKSEIGYLDMDGSFTVQKFTNVDHIYEFDIH